MNIQWDKGSLFNKVFRKPDRYMEKNKIRLPSYTIHKTLLKIDYRLYCKTSNYKTSKRKHRQ